MKKQKKQKRMLTVLSEITHGTQWLAQLTEPIFRDEILKELFSRMKKEKAIGEFLNVHGRNEHGVDWIVEELGGISSRIIGIQAKSRPITKQGDSKSDNALSIKHQCESAYDNRFLWRGNEIRLDVVELWTSSHITTDAEQELAAPGASHKVPVKRPETIYALIEKYCPTLITKIPGLAETSYIRRMADPSPLPIRLLGIQLNPKNHFLEPRFSRYPELSPARVLDSKRNKSREEPSIHLEDILSSREHTLVVGNELSGKTYILLRLSCILAEMGHLPVIVDGSKLASNMPSSTPRLLKEYLSWYQLNALEQPDTVNRDIYLLIDNADVLSDEQIATLRETTHKRIIMIMTGRKSRELPGIATLFIAGLKSGTLPRFVRTLDISQSSGTALCDRATQFINRTIGTSGLPINPFTVSVMLGECHISQRKLATPTMGRLIERFVEDQLGSHSDSLRVDYETKLQFLTNIGGSHEHEFPLDNFRRRLIRYLSKHGHAHVSVDVEQDLIESGLLECDATKGVIRWTHSIFKNFFWVRNLVREKKNKTITKRLLLSGGQCIAAIAGSQMGNAHPVLVDLLNELKDKDWMKPLRRISGVAAETIPDGIFPTDKVEEEILQSIEKEATDPMSGSGVKEIPQHTDKKSSSVTETVVESKSASLFAMRMVEEKHDLVATIASLLVNSRNLTRDDKDKAVLCVLRSSLRISKNIAEAIRSLPHLKANNLLSDMMGVYIGFTITDMLIGDVFLAAVIKGLRSSVVNRNEMLGLTDLLVACGEVSPLDYEKALNGNNGLANVIAVYIRLLSIYYFRFHCADEKKEIREALKHIRKLAKGFTLPPV